MAIALTREQKALVDYYSKWVDSWTSKDHWTTYRPRIFLPLSDGGYDVEMGVVINYHFDSFKVLEDKGVMYIGWDLSKKQKVEPFGFDWGPGGFGIMSMLMDAFRGDGGEWDFEMSEKGRKKLIEDLAKEGLDIVGEHHYYREIADTDTIRNFKKVYEKYASKTKAEMVLKVKKIHTLSNSKKLFPIMALDFNTDKVLWWGDNSKEKKGIMTEYKKSVFDLTKEDVDEITDYSIGEGSAFDYVVDCKAICNGKEAKYGEEDKDWDMSWP